MSHPSSTHHHSLPNSIPPTHHHHQPNLTAPIQPESDNDDVVFLTTVSKVVHTPEDYDPECQCCTCQLVRRLLEKCTCEECKGQQTNQVNQTEGQVVLHSENVPIANAVSPTNGQPSSSSIQNNDASTSEHTNANDLDDDRESRSSTPDYMPRFFDDESGDSQSDSESENSVDSGVDQNDMELDQESECDDDGNKSNPDYAFDDNGDDNELDENCDSDNDNDDDDPDYAHSKPSSSKPKKLTSKSSAKHLKAMGLEKKHKCPLCNQRFTLNPSLRRHYRVIHQQIKPYYCKWPMCGHMLGRRDNMIEHIIVRHLNGIKNLNKAKDYVGFRKLAHQKDSVLSKSCNLLTSATNHQVTGNEANSNQIKSSDDKNQDNSDCDKSEESNINQINSFDCPKCEASFDLKHRLVRHYRSVHHKWKPYYCRWPKCDFVSGLHDNVVNHANRKHFNEKSREKARKYVAKREGTPPRDPVLEQIVAMNFGGGSILNSTTFNTNCPKCGRDFKNKGNFVEHLRSHAYSGFRCAWHNCGAFYSQYTFAKKHLLTLHFKGKLVNETQVTKYLVKVDPSLDSSSRI